MNCCPAVVAPVADRQEISRLGLSPALSGQRLPAEQQSSRVRSRCRIALAVSAIAAASRGTQSPTGSLSRARAHGTGPWPSSASVDTTIDSGGYSPWPSLPVAALLSAEWPP